MRTSSDEERAKAGLEFLPEIKGATHATPALSEALQSEGNFAFQVLEIFKTENCFFRDTSSNELKNLHELETGSALH